MPVTATGDFSLPLENLRTLIAAGANFQAWVGAANADAAKANIHLNSLLKSDLVRPYALIDVGPNWLADSIAGGAGSTFQHGGSLRLLLVADIAAEHESNDADAKLTFMNAIGGIVADMESLAGTDDYLFVNRVELADEPQRPRDNRKKTEGNYYKVEFLITWGT